MSTVTAVRYTRSSALVRGETDIVVDALLATGVSFRWAPQEHAYIVPLTVLDRVLVAVENAGHSTDWRTGLW